jgi:broad specificity phosphatase PhoE
MQLILVRHGESVLNAQHRHQYPSVPLSENGQLQAQLLSNRLKQYKFDRILSSPLQRARETAEIISSQQLANVEYLELLQEIRRPAILMGSTHQEPEMRVIWDEMIAHMPDPNWHYADEENWWDVKKRTEQFLDQIESATDTNILAVTHGTFIRMVLSLMIKGRGLTSQDFWDLVPTMHTDNTCVSVVELQKGKWNVRILCDISHLKG